MSQLHQATCRAQEFFSEKLAEFTYQVCQTTIQYLGYFHHNRFRQDNGKENQSNIVFFGVFCSFNWFNKSRKERNSPKHMCTSAASSISTASIRAFSDFALVPWDLFSISLILLGPIKPRSVNHLSPTYLFDRFRQYEPSRFPHGFIKTYFGSFESDLELPLAVRFLEPDLVSL
jgi:hypothetical protein